MSPTSMTRAEVMAMIERHRVAFASRNPELLAAGHTEDGTFESQAAGVVRGRAKIQGVYEYWLSLFWHFRGTLAGEFFGHTQPGARVEFKGAGEYDLSPEGIVHARHVFDFTGALVSAGVLKVKPAQ